MKQVLLICLTLLLALTACSKTQEAVPLVHLPSGYGVENAKKDQCVVLENGDVTAGQAVWDEFLQISNQGKEAAVRLAYSYTLEDPSHYGAEHYEELKGRYPVLYMKELVFDGKRYTLQGYEDGELITREYPYLLKYEGTPASETAIYSSYTYYVLVHEETVTWEDIERGMLSSCCGDWVDHYRVYSDLVLK